MAAGAVALLAANHDVPDPGGCELGLIKMNLHSQGRRCEALPRPLGMKGVRANEVQ